MNKYWVFLRLVAGGVPLIASFIYARVLNLAEFQDVIGAISVIMMSAIALKMGKDSRVREIYVNHGLQELSRGSLKAQSEKVAYIASYSVAKTLLTGRSIPFSLFLIVMISNELSVLSLFIYAGLAILVAANSMISVGDRYIGNMLQAIFLDGVIFHITTLGILCIVVLFIPGGMMKELSFFIVLLSMSILTFLRMKTSGSGVLYQGRTPGNMNVALLSMLGSFTSWGVLYGFSKTNIPEIETVIISFQVAISLQIVRSINTSWFSAYYSKDILLKNTSMLRQSLNIAMLSIVLGLTLTLVMTLLAVYAGIPFSVKYALLFMSIEIILTVSSPILAHQINLGNSRPVLYVMLMSHIPLTLILLFDLKLHEITLLLVATSLLKLSGAIVLSRVYSNENISN